MLSVVRSSTPYILKNTSSPVSIRRINREKTRFSCPLCGKRLKEINTAHLKHHGMDYQEFKKIFPSYNTLSDKVRKKKRTIVEVTPEMSKRLRYGHTLEAKVKKYGLEEGTRRHKESLERYSHSKTLQGHIDRLGEEAGRKAWELRLKSAAEGTRKAWENPTPKMKIRGTLRGYQNRWGLEEGLKRWISKCNKHSEANSKIPLDQREEYRLYKFLVGRVTNQSIVIYYPGMLERRSKSYHLDHKFSVLEGFRNRLDPYLPGSIWNLELLPRSENCSKQHKCSITLSDLLESFSSDEHYRKLVDMDFLELRGQYFEFYEKFGLDIPGKCN